MFQFAKEIAHTTYYCVFALVLLYQTAYLFQVTCRPVPVNDSKHFFVLAHLDGASVALNSFVDISCLEVFVSLIF